MNGYTKLFASIITSTIWREDNETRILWITMMALANRDGVVEASIPGLADMAKISLEKCKAGLVILSSEDEYSRTKDNKGIRIKEVDGGWLLLNHQKYRAKMGLEERREYLRLKQQEYRGKVKAMDKEKSLRQVIKEKTDADEFQEQESQSPEQAYKFTPNEEQILEDKSAAQ